MWNLKDIRWNHIKSATTDSDFSFTSFWRARCIILQVYSTVKICRAGFQIQNLYFPWNDVHSQSSFRLFAVTGTYATFKLNLLIHDWEWKMNQDSCCSYKPKILVWKSWHMLDSTQQLDLERLDSADKILSVVGHIVSGHGWTLYVFRAGGMTSGHDDYITISKQFQSRYGQKVWMLWFTTIMTCYLLIK